MSTVESVTYRQLAPGDRFSHNGRLGTYEVIESKLIPYFSKEVFNDGDRVDLTLRNVETGAIAKERVVSHFYVRRYV